MLRRLWKKPTLRIALACLLVAFLPAVRPLSGAMNNFWRVLFERPFSVPREASWWSFQAANRVPSPPGWTCGEDAERFYFASDTGVRAMAKVLFPPDARLCDSVHTPDTLLPEEILLPDTSQAVRDTLLSDTTGLGRFVDSLQRSLQTGRALFLRRHLARNVQGGEVWGDRPEIVRALRDPAQARLLLRVLRTTLADGIRLRRTVTAPVVVAPADDPDSCRVPASEDDPDGPCVRVLDTSVHWVDSSADLRGSLSTRWAVLISSRGGDSTAVASMRLSPVFWKVRTTDGRIGWIPSAALAPRDDPGACLVAGRTPHGWRITTLQMCGERE
jgi:hypothetical protein